MYDAEAKVFIIEDTKMHYVVFGKGEKPLLIIPGLSDGIQNVKKFPKALSFFYREYAKKYKVFICSRKNKLPEGYTTQEMANDIRLFMDAQNIRNAYVAGNSMGGMIAQHLAVDYPDYVEKLIIAVSASKLSQTSKEVVKSWKRMVEQNDYEGLVIDTIEKTHTDKNLWKFRPFYFLIKRIVKPQNTENFLAQANACLEHDASERTERIQCPVLVIGGEKDEVVGGEASRILARQISNSRLIMYPELGHDAFQESKQFEKDFISFLNEDVKR